MLEIISHYFIKYSKDENKYSTLKETMIFYSIFLYNLTVRILMVIIALFRIILLKNGVNVFDIILLTRTYLSYKLQANSRGNHVN